MAMNNKIYIATFAENCLYYAEKYNCGLEIDEFCTADNMAMFKEWQKKFNEYFTTTEDFIIHAPFNDLVPVSIDSKIREVALLRYHQIFEIADKLNVRKLNFHTGYIPNTTFEEWYFDNFKEFWFKLGTQYKEFEVVIENVFESNPFSLKKTVDEINLDNIGLCLDVGHVNCSSDCTVEKWIEVFYDRLRHMHIHNNKGVVDDHNGITEGDIDVLSALNTAPEGVGATIECSDVKSSLKFLKTVDII